MSAEPPFGSAGEEARDAARDAAPRVGAVVLAAGRSRRMGTSKALLDAGGEPFVARVVHALRAGGAAPVVVVVRAGADAVAEAARAAGATVVVNPDPDHPQRGGPASSLREGLGAMPEDVAGALVHPVDHPRVEPGTVAALIADFATHGAPVTSPAVGGRSGHPVLFARRLFAELLEPGLAEGARTVVHRHADGRREVPVDDAGVVDDLDTPAAYARAFPHGAGPRTRAETRVVDPAAAAEQVLAAVEAGRRAVVVLDPAAGGDRGARRRVVAEAHDGSLAATGSVGDADRDREADALAGALLDGSLAEGLHEGLYLELHLPRPELVIVGAGHIAQPLCAVGALLGFRVSVLDDRPAFATRERFPEAERVLPVDFSDPFADVRLHALTHVVLVTRGHRYDYECLRRILAAERQPRYVGMIGSRRRVRATWEALLREGVPAERLEHVRAPVGLDLGAETPAEIAVSVAAELVLAWRGGTGRPLREVERVLERFFEPQRAAGEAP